MGITVAKRKYVLDLLKETRMLSCKLTNMLMDYTTKLGIVEGSALIDKGKYQRLIGKLIYLSHTKPNIVFSISVVRRLMNSATEEHMKIMYHILRYLKMIIQPKVLYGPI